MSLFLEIEQPGMLVHIGRQILRTPARLDVTGMDVKLIRRQLASDGISGYYFIKTSSSNELSQSSDSSDSNLEDLREELSELKDLIKNISRSHDIKSKQSSTTTPAFIPSVNIEDLHASMNDHGSNVIGRVNKDKFSTIVEKLKENNI